MRLILLIVSFLFFSLSTYASLTINYKPGELIVQFKSNNAIETTLNNLNERYPDLNIHEKRVLSKRMNIWLLGFNENYGTVESVNELVGNHSNVQLVQANHTNVRLRNTPNDKAFDIMWGLSNSTNEGADISAEAAWEITTGGVTRKGDTIVVAVIDDGFDLDHEDMDYWKNRAEIPNNNIDDDNNGFTDDYDGWNAFNNNGNIRPDFHGTHVSGTVGAIGNNGIGVVGVNWNVKIMPIMGSDSEESTVIEAYGFVLEHRALYNETNGEQGSYIVARNSSFGVDNGKPSQYPIWCSFYDSLGAYGILNVGATVNSNTNVDVKGDIPTTCPSDYMIGVTNTDIDDQKEKFAGYGVTHIDLGAPGEGIYSTTPDDTYAYESGTSMASPHVAGAIALMYAEICDTALGSFVNNPADLALEIKQMLLDGVDQLPALDGLCVTGGRLNIHKALLAVQESNICNNSRSGDSGNSPKKISIYPNPANGRVTISYDEDNMDIASIIFLDALGKVVMRNDEVASKTKSSIAIGTYDLNKGIYFVQVINNNQETESITKLVIY